MRRFGLAFNLNLPAFSIGDAFIVLIIAVLLYVGARLAIRAPAVVTGPDISLAPAALPWYAFLSTARMAIAYLFSLSLYPRLRLHGGAQPHAHASSCCRCSTSCKACRFCRFCRWCC